jgi:HrpA-like RNA helicase
MAALPLDPAYAHLLLSSQSLGCTAEVLTAVSVLSTDTLFLQPHREEEKQLATQAHRNFASKDGDLATLLNVFDAWIKVCLLHDQD